jgi:hypothetical protein
MLSDNVYKNFIRLCMKNCMKGKYEGHFDMGCWLSK